MIMRLQHQRPDGEIDTYHLKPGRRYHIGRGSACEVRILDLKLSRKHCAVEFNEGSWHIVDLLSTNGCKLDGEQIVGTVRLATGKHIEAGQTVLTVAEILDPTTNASEVPLAMTSEAGDEVDHTETTRPSFEQETLPDDDDGNSQGEQQDSGVDWEPEPAAEKLNRTDALIPNRPLEKTPVNSPTQRPPTAPVSRRPTVEPRRPTAVFRSEDLKVEDAADAEKTHVTPRTAPTPSSQPAAEAPAPEAAPATAGEPPTGNQERSFFITVLGRRVGPLTRAAARELKARELRGTLTTSDLDQYPLG